MDAGCTPDECIPDEFIPGECIPGECIPGECIPLKDSSETLRGNLDLPIIII